MLLFIFRSDQSRILEACWYWRSRYALKRILASRYELVVLVRGKLAQPPLVLVVIVIIHVVIDSSLDFRELSSTGQFVLDKILHVPEKALLRGIVPTVTAPGHRLTKAVILDYVNELVTCIMAALITMYQGFRMERNAMLIDQYINCLEDEVDLQRVAQNMRQHLLCERIHNH